MTIERLAGLPTWLLSRASARAHVLLRESFDDEGVRGYHFRLLAALDQDGPCSQAHLGRLAEIDRSDVVAALDELVDWGWVRRDLDPADRRRNVVTLTTPGRKALLHLDGVVAAAQERVLEPLSPSERRTLVRLLAKLGQ